MTERTALIILVETADGRRTWRYARPDEDARTTIRALRPDERFAAAGLGHAFEVHVFRPINEQEQA